MGTMMVHIHVDLCIGSKTVETHGRACYEQLQSVSLEQLLELTRGFMLEQPRTRANVSQQHL